VEGNSEDGSERVDDQRGLSVTRDGHSIRENATVPYPVMS